MISALRIALEALCYRIRGGMWGSVIPGGTQVPRLIWSASVGLSLYLATQNLLSALIAAPLAFAGLMLPHGWAQNDDWLGRIGMGAVTVGRLALILTPLGYLTDPFTLFYANIGWGAGLAYWVGYRCNFSVDNFRPTELGEWLTGALYGVTFVALSV